LLSATTNPRDGVGDDESNGASDGNSAGKRVGSLVLQAPDGGASNVLRALAPLMQKGKSLVLGDYSRIMLRG
jgi:hypothetical protein